MLLLVIGANANYPLYWLLDLLRKAKTLTGRARFPATPITRNSVAHLAAILVKDPAALDNSEFANGTHE